VCEWTGFKSASSCAGLGSLGQIGSEVVVEMRERYGKKNVIASDIRLPPKGSKLAEGQFLTLDACDKGAIVRAVSDNKVTWVVQLAAILSAAGEKDPFLALRVNVDGIENILEVARQFKLRVFSPSTIAVFGPSTPREKTPDDTIMRPTTMYGVTKVYMELLGEYYYRKFGVDFRSVRYPGIISSQTMPGGGTTDYAVEIYHEALKLGHYRCFLQKDTQMPMMYASDCLNACISLLEAPDEKLLRRVYNVSGFSFTPEELAASIKKELPHFSMSYMPDPLKQGIADSWPMSLDDANARREWGWKPKYTSCKEMTDEMLKQLRLKYQK